MPKAYTEAMWVHVTHVQDCLLGLPIVPKGQPVSRMRTVRAVLATAAGAKMHHEDVCELHAVRLDLAWPLHGL